jgi:hypothetical protein
MLLALIAVQLILGVEAWLSKFTTTAPLVQLTPFIDYPDLLRSMHLLVGSLVFACSVVVALRVYLGRGLAIKSGAALAHRLEGAP